MLIKDLISLLAFIATSITAILFLFYTLPSEYTTHNSLDIGGLISDKEFKENTKIKRNSKLGKQLLFLGIIFQALAFVIPEKYTICLLIPAFFQFKF